ncbi:NUDIX hydrolase [Neobacillus sp. D3-1R]|uniref:NUDIX hydrolase n=1 Tax=Neobacillus sp. D3-1R TaxID=3445778 RepID=UPI003F9EC81D
METELIRVLDKHGKPIGVATREEVHKKGYWHETFHCWLIDRENDTDYIYFQKRSERKKDYPNLLDITAAGHILSHETIADGIREVKEEIGVDIQMEELIPLGVIQYSVVDGDLMDNELANVFLYHFRGSMADFTLQQDEVSGIYKVRFNDFYELLFGAREDIEGYGVEMDNNNNLVKVKKVMSKKEFAPHAKGYYEKILKLINENLMK